MTFLKSNRNSKTSNQTRLQLQQEMSPEDIKNN